MVRGSITVTGRKCMMSTIYEKINRAYCKHRTVIFLLQFFNIITHEGFIIAIITVQNQKIIIIKPKQYDTFTICDNCNSTNSNCSLPVSSTRFFHITFKVRRHPFTNNSMKTFVCSTLGKFNHV